MDELTPIERSWAEAMPDRASGECLEAEELLELAESGKRARDYFARMAHIAICPACRTTLKMLNAAEAVRPARKLVISWPAMRYLAIAGVAAALLFAVWLGTLKGQNSIRPTTPVAVRSPDKAPSIVRPAPKAPPRHFAQNKPAPSLSPATHRKSATYVARAHRRPHRHLPNIPFPPAPDRLVKNIPSSGASGVLEGAVVYSEVVEGEVGASGGIVEGEVTKKTPPPGG